MNKPTLLQDSLAWQKFIFAEKLSRFDLIKLKLNQGAISERIRVSRNHAFEPVASVLDRFLGFAGVQAELVIGDYDDSLSFPPSDASIELIWLDFTRYTSLNVDELASWLIERLAGLRARTRAHIVVANSPDSSARDQAINSRLREWAAASPGVAILDMAEISAQLGPGVFDLERAALTGTRLSNSACLEAARTIGLQVIPDFVLPRIKAIALDLDQTFYSGVLGEDGIHGVALTESHRELHMLLKTLSDRGILITVMSRNERSDVEALFKERDDFLLRSENIAGWKISWGSKADAIRQAASEFRIGVDSFLFIDDNLGEVTEVCSRFPGIKAIFAGYSAADTLAAVKRFPALWSDQISETDALRVADLKANAERESLAAEASDVNQYLGALGVKLSFALDPRDDIGRLRDISAKTNQFNLALARLSEVDVETYLSDPECRIVHFWMADKLSDSGSVGSIYARRDGNTLYIDELCISCRAMGRMLEDVIVTEAIRGVQEALPTEKVRFAYAAGPRNEPARNWLKAYLNADVSGQSGLMDMQWTADRVERYVTSTPVSILWKKNDH